MREARQVSTLSPARKIFFYRNEPRRAFAGRVGLTNLLPLSFAEARQTLPDLTAEEFMLRGAILVYTR